MSSLTITPTTASSVRLSSAGSLWAALPLADFGTSKWDSTAVIGVAVNLEGSGVEPAAGAACAVLARPPASTTAMTAVTAASTKLLRAR